MNTAPVLVMLSTRPRTEAINERRPFVVRLNRGGYLSALNEYGYVFISKRPGGLQNRSLIESIRDGGSKYDEVAV